MDHECDRQTDKQTDRQTDRQDYYGNIVLGNTVHCMVKTDKKEVLILSDNADK